MSSSNSSAMKLLDLSEISPEVQKTIKMLRDIEPSSVSCGSRDVALNNFPTEKFNTLPLFGSCKPCTQTTSLDRLPPEIFTMICYKLDLRSLMVLTRICRSYRLCVSGLRAMSRLSEHGKRTVAVLDRAGVLSRTSVASILDALVTNDCACGKPALKVYYGPPVRRLCVDCAASTDLSPWPAVTLQRELGFKSIAKLEKRVPFMYAFQGDYTTTRRKLVSAVDAREILRLEGKNVVDAPDTFSASDAMVFLPFVEPKTDECCYGTGCPGCKESKVVALLNDSWLKDADVNQEVTKRLKWAREKRESQNRAAERG